MIIFVGFSAYLLPTPLNPSFSSLLFFASALPRFPVFSYPLTLLPSHLLSFLHHSSFIILSFPLLFLVSLFNWVHGFNLAVFI